jgi:hypothetical protein
VKAVLLGAPALFIAGLVASGAVAAGIIGPRLHRRHPAEEARPEADLSTARGPVEARRQAGPSYFTGPGA